MHLVKIYDTSCTICSEIGDTPKELADREGWSYESITMQELAATFDNRRAYVVSVYVEPNDGMIDLPLILIETDDGFIQASGVVKDLGEVNNLIQSWKTWNSTKNAQSAD